MFYFFLRLVGACAEILLFLPPKYQYTFCCVFLLLWSGQILTAFSSLTMSKELFYRIFYWMLFYVSIGRDG